MTNPDPLIHQPKRFHLDWLPDIFFHPRQVFTNLAARSQSTWLTPLLTLTITALALIVTTGWLEKQAAQSGSPQLPPNFEYYTPEQQAQYLQTLDARQGPVFLYVIPGLAAAGGVWLGWLIVSGLLHLFQTMLGGRGDTNLTLNIVAWASLPLALRDGVRVLYMLATKQMVLAPGISGFVDPLQGNANLFLSGLLALIDIYWVWYIILATLGTTQTTRLSTQKAFTAVLICIGALTLTQALITYGVSSLSSLTIIRPFF